MSSLSLAYLRLRWLHLPAAFLMLLLQRTPVLRVLVSSEFVLSSTASTVLKGVLAGATALGAVQAVAGATTLNPAAGTSTNPAQATVGVPFTGGFAVIGAPKTAGSYEIKGTLPPGLTVAGLSGDTVNASVVTITGTPTLAGEYPLSVRAWNSANKKGDGGKPTFTYTISVAGGTPATLPVIATQPVSRTVNVGASVTFSVTATGDPAPSYQWRKDTTAINGASSASYTIAAANLADAGSYDVLVHNAAGSVTSAAAVLTVQPLASTVPVFTLQPVSHDVTAGSTVTLSVAATPAASINLQWYRYRQGDGSPQAVAGGSGTSLVLTNVQTADMGSYYAIATSGTESVRSSTALVTVTGGISRLANLSTFGRVLPGGTLTPGFVLGGTGPKSLLIRSVGPGLVPYFGADALGDPTMTVNQLGGGAAILTNDNWGDVADISALRAAMAKVGAFPLTEGSKDAAAIVPVTVPNANGNGGYPVAIKSTSSTAGGIALAEVYDPDPIGSPVKLINVATLGFTGPGADALVSGFVIDGTGAKTMLIRVVGPSLGELFGVGGTMTNPRLSIFPSGQTFSIGSNDDWGGTTALKAAFTKSGAFGFASDTSLDAAIVLRLPPGGYSVVIEGGSGNVLLEAYDLD